MKRFSVKCSYQKVNRHYICVKSSVGKIADNSKMYDRIAHVLDLSVTRAMRICLLKYRGQSCTFRENHRTVGATGDLQPSTYGTAVRSSSRASAIGAR